MRRTDRMLPSVYLVEADVVVERFIGGQEFEQDAMLAIDRIGPKSLEIAFQRMGLQTRIEGVRSEPAVFDCGLPFDGSGQTPEGPLEVRGYIDLQDRPGHEGLGQVRQGADKPGSAFPMGRAPFTDELQDLGRANPGAPASGLEHMRDFGPRNADNKGVLGHRHRSMPKHRFLSCAVNAAGLSSFPSITDDPLSRNRADGQMVRGSSHETMDSPGDRSSRIRRDGRKEGMRACVEASCQR